MIHTLVTPVLAAQPGGGTDPRRARVAPHAFGAGHGPLALLNLSMRFALLAHVATSMLDYGEMQYMYRAGVWFDETLH